jgi:D-methionine transport system permease protein
MRYGYQRLETTVMIAVVLVVIAFVGAVQAGGDRVTQQIDHRAK